MQGPVGDVVILQQGKNLRFVDVAAVGQAVDDPVRVMEKHRPEILGIGDALPLRIAPQPGGAAAGVRESVVSSRRRFSAAMEAKMSWGMGASFVSYYTPLRRLGP
jgi:hypothetical protein